LGNLLGKLDVGTPDPVSAAEVFALNFKVTKATAIDVEDRVRVA
jgi:hypothetical protein